MGLNGLDHLLMVNIEAKLALSPEFINNDSL